MREISDSQGMHFYGLWSMVYGPSSMVHNNINEQTKLNNAAFLEAENDIEEDPELHDEPEAGDDLDEGELARFEGEE